MAVRLDAKQTAALRKFHGLGTTPTGQLQKATADQGVQIIHALRKQAVAQADIAKVCGVSERTIRNWTSAADELAAIELVEAQEEQPTDPELIEAMKPFTADAFELFFNAYSGLILPAHCKRWVEAFVSHRLVTLQVPPRHAKSTIMSVWIPLWLICRDRNVNVIIFSKTSLLAAEFCRRIATQLEYNLRMIDDWGGEFAPPHVGAEDGGRLPWRTGRGELQVLGSSTKKAGAQLTLLARGSGTQTLGFAGDFVILDDVTDAKTSASDADRDKMLDWARNEALSRLQPGDGKKGRALVIGQRVHLRDLYGELQNQTHEIGALKGENVWHTEQYPAILKWPDEDKAHPEPEVLWPEEWSYEELTQTVYPRIGGRRPFMTMYQQAPEAEGGGLYLREWKSRVVDEDRPAWRPPIYDEADEDSVVRVFAVDPSPTQYQGFVLADLIYDRAVAGWKDLHMLAVWNRKAEGMTPLIQEMRRVVDAFDPTYLIWESSTFSDFLLQSPDFKRDIEGRVKVIRQLTTSSSKGSTEYGLMSLGGDFEFGRIHLPYGDAEARTLTDEFLREAEEYPDGRLDDRLMALWFIKNQARSLRPRHTAAPVSLGNDSWGFIRRAKEGAQQTMTVAAYRGQRGNSKERARERIDFEKRAAEAGIELGEAANDDIT